MVHWWNSLLGQFAIVVAFRAASATLAWYIESLLSRDNVEKQITPIGRGNDPLTEQEFWTTTLRKQRNLNWWTGLAASAATAAFVVLYLTLRDNEKSFEASQRAYVGLGTKGGLIAEFGRNLGGSNKPLLMVYVFNAGQSVAGHLSVQVRAKLPGIFRGRHRFRYRNSRKLLTQVPSNELDL